MHIKQLRKKIKDEKWLTEKLYYYANIEKDLLYFHDFKCSSAFVGTTLARLNIRKYNKEYDKNCRKIQQIENFLDKINVR
jgi:hypothetical protein